MNRNERLQESAQHALEVHLAACLLFAETRWKRTVTNMPREAVVRLAVREGCDALIELARIRRDHPRPHDLDPE